MSDLEKLREELNAVFLQFSGDIPPEDMSVASEALKQSLCGAFDATEQSVITTTAFNRFPFGETSVLTHAPRPTEGRTSEELFPILGVYFSSAALTTNQASQVTTRLPVQKLAWSNFLSLAIGRNLRLDNAVVQIKPQKEVIPGRFVSLSSLNTTLNAPKI